jgi:hypothetical protein
MNPEKVKTPGRSSERILKTPTATFTRRVKAKASRRARRDAVTNVQIADGSGTPDRVTAHPRASPTRTAKREKGSRNPSTPRTLLKKKKIVSQLTGTTTRNQSQETLTGAGTPSGNLKEEKVANGHTKDRNGNLW